MELSRKQRRKQVVKKKSNETVQPEINIGMVGHVDHGKTTLVQTLTGKWTDTHSEEIKRGITIKLGYANTSFYKCESCNIYTPFPKCEGCGKETKFLRKVSFVDAPGHESLMATMLCGAAIMDGALLLIAANQECPQPQTREHLMALEIVGIKNIIIVQNKIDLVSKEQAIKNYEQIKGFIRETIAEKAPIIPISAQRKVNISYLIEAIENNIKTPSNDSSKDPLLYIARSFDINKPGTEIENIQGGIIGGSLKQGSLKIHDKIEIRPGRSVEREGKKIWEAITTEIISLASDKDKIKEAFPGGSIGALTKLDPYYVKADSLAGCIAGLSGKMPEVHYEFWLKPHLLKRVVGTKEELTVENIKKTESLMINVNSAATVGIVTELKKDLIYVKLRAPVCCEKDDRITISRMIGQRWRLIGFGTIR